MSKVTKKTVRSALKEAKTVDDCKAILREINSQIGENNKVIARNQRIANSLGEEDKVYRNELDQSTQVKENWNMGLEKVKDEVYDVWDKVM